MLYRVLKEAIAGLTLELICIEGKGSAVLVLNLSSLSEPRADWGSDWEELMLYSEGLVTLEAFSFPG